MNYREKILLISWLTLLLIIPLSTAYGQGDSVDWSNINLNYKPPMPGKTYGEFVAQPQPIKDDRAVAIDNKTTDADPGEEDAGDSEVTGQILLDGNSERKDIPDDSPQTGPGDGGLIAPKTFLPNPPTDNISFGNPQGIGELFGIAGPIIVCGEIEKNCAIAIFDPTGACIGTVTGNQAKNDPQRMGRLLAMAEALGRADFNRILQQGLNQGKKKVLSPAFSATQPPALQLGQQPKTLAGDHIEMLHRDRAQLQKELTDMEGALGNIPENGDEAAQESRAFIENNIANHRQKINEIDQKIGEIQGNLQQGQSPQPLTSDPSLGPDGTQGIGDGTGIWNTISPRLGFSYDIRGDGSNVLRTRLQQQGLELNHIDAFQPSAVMLPQLGQPQIALDQLAADLNKSLTARRNACNEKCFKIYIGRPKIYIIETIFGRVVLEKDPNDPLYGYGKKKKKGGLLKTVTLGIFGGGGGGDRFAGGGIYVDGGERARRNTLKIKNQWGLHTIGYLPKSHPESAWKIFDGSEKNVLIAVIDSGLYMKHPDGPKHIWTNPDEIPDNGIDDDANGYIDDIHGWNFYNNNNKLTDLRGHGTFVSGIIAAQRNNGIGIAGINPGAEIMMLKVTDKYGNTNSLNIYRAIRYAVDQGAKIINISLGGKGVSQLEQLAINYAYAQGALLVVASGNIGEDIMEHGPAAAQRAFVVGSLDFSGKRSTISHTGANNGLLAPGEEIFSLHSKDAPWEGGSADRKREYYKASGTSFAVPMVTATASLMLAKNPELTNRQIMDILLTSATDLDPEGWDERTGAGILNATQALLSSPDDIVAAQITLIKLNRQKKKLESVDIYASVHGKDLKEFVVELGRGKKARKFKTIAGPFNQEANNSWVRRLDERELRGSRDWVVRIKATDNQGEVTTARAYFSTKYRR